jgi:alpha-1,6-mannosyltransferase
VKTLHLTNSWHPTSGGIAVFYRELMAAANRRGHQMRLIVPAAQDGIEDVGPCGRIYRIAAPVAPLNPSYRVMYPREFLTSASRIQRILMEERPDVVEICDKYNLNYLGALIRLRLMEKAETRPLVVGFSCERMDDNIAAYLGGGAFTRWFSRLYMRWLYFPMFDHLIANSEHTAAELRPASQGHPVTRGVWSRPMGVDTARFSRERRREILRDKLLTTCRGGHNSSLLLYAGRLAPEKNLGLLMETMEQLVSAEPGCHLLIAGEGMEKEKLRQRADARLPGRVHFLGFVKDREDLADLYANCDVFLHPNPNEPFGIAPLEAMASGLPLVAPNSGGVTSYASGDNAWLVEPTAAAFADAVLEVLRNAQLRAARVEAASAMAGRFAWPNVAADYLDLYEEMLRLFQGGETRPGMEPLFVSSPGSGRRNMTIERVARLAKKAFSSWKRWNEPKASPPVSASAPAASSGPCAPIQS